MRDGCFHFLFTSIVFFLHLNPIIIFLLLNKGTGLLIIVLFCLH